MRLLAFLAACSTALPPAPRAPSQGVPAHWFPDMWREPAVLCVGGREHGYVPTDGWRCL